MRGRRGGRGIIRRSEGGFVMYDVYDVHDVLLEWWSDWAWCWICLYYYYGFCIISTAVAFGDDLVAPEVCKKSSTLIPLVQIGVFNLSLARFLLC